MKTGERVSFSPGEFAALFGKQQTWGYRQIYAGKVNAITEFGRIQIPAAEVERILATAGRYEGMPKERTKTKAQYEAMKPELQSAWQEFIRRKRTTNRCSSKVRYAPSVPRSAVEHAEARSAAFARLKSKRC